jgi:uncharacterized metal-binding protein YceD (DUF177 family)
MKNTAPALPIRHVFDLGDLSQAGSTVTVTAKGDELARLAKWAGLDAVRAFGGNITLSRLSQSRFVLEADLEADIVQSCVVTLEPLETHISRHIARELHFVRHADPGRGELTLAAGDDEVPETINTLDYDLAAPLLEEFVLAIDPYPRKEGAAFAPLEVPEEAPENPFGVLKKLKVQD